MKEIHYVQISSINPLYLIIGNVDGYIEEKNGNKYLTQNSTDNNKELLAKYTKLWDGINNLIIEMNDKPGKYGKDFMKIKFNSADDLPLNKTLKLHNLTTFVRSVFQEDGKYYPQDILDDCLYEW